MCPPCVRPWFVGSFVTARSHGQVSCGLNVTAGVTTKGQLYTWGSCEYFALGHHDRATSREVPTVVEALKDIPIAFVDVGEFHCAAVSENGDLFTWGWGGGLLYGTWSPAASVRVFPLECREGCR